MKKTKTTLSTTFKTDTGTPPLTRFFGPGKNRVKGKPRYRRSILVLKPQNGEFKSSKSTFSQVFHKVKRNLMQRILILDILLLNCTFEVVATAWPILIAPPEKPTPVPADR